MVAVIRTLLAAALLAGCATTPVAHTSVRDGGVHLAVEGLPEGARVTVAGTFNGWDVEGPALQEAAPGRYETLIDLQPGTHRLQLVVRTPDGAERWLPPPGLVRYEPDGFGGTNAVIDVRRNLRADGSSYEEK